MVVLAPDALLIAVRVNDPVTGMDCTKDPAMLPNPKAINSWVASMIFPLAAARK